MAMLLDLPKLPRDVVDRIRTYVYGPQIPAFLARYGERITAHVKNAHPFAPCISTHYFMNYLRIHWQVGLGRFDRRFLWCVPQHAFRYLTRGMPVLIQFGRFDMSMYTVIEMRRSSLLVRVGPCEIEIPTTLIIELTIYVDIPEALLYGRTRGKPWLCPAFNDDEFEMNLNEREAIKREKTDQYHSLCGCAANDTVAIARARYNNALSEMFLTSGGWPD